MKVLIADDEQASRNYLVTAIDWKGCGYELYEAENGQAAIDLMKRIKIDLAILDITMPIVNGLEVLHWMQDCNYSCIVSLLTCHDEFQYAVQALQSGCFDYLLKSEITDERFQALLGRMSLEASADARQKQQLAILQTTRQRNELLENQSHINYWLHHDPAADKDMAHFFSEKLHFAADMPGFVLMVIHIPDYTTVVQRYAGNDNVQFFSILDNIINELFVTYRLFHLPTNEGEFTVFLGMEQKLPLYQITQDILHAAKTLNGSLLQIECRVHYSLPFSDMLQSHSVYRRMELLTALSFYPPLAQTLCISDYITDPLICEPFLQKASAALLEGMKQRNAVQTEIVYDAVVSQISNGLYCIPPTDFTRMCDDCLREFIISCSGSAPLSGTKSDYTSSAAYKKYLLHLLQPFCIPDHTQDKKSLVKKSILLIQQHYSEDIGLDWISQKLSVNSSYLSHLFSQEVGQSLNIYINQYRIDQAKKMIESSNLKLYEIAEKTGYSSSIVFSSVFKKYTGETPTNYKNRIL